VERVVTRMAFFVDMGRDLRARHDPTWDLELNQCSVVLCEARTKQPAPAYRSGIQRGRGASKAGEQRLVAAVEATLGSFVKSEDLVPPSMIEFLFYVMWIKVVFTFR
jgi:hypothetical protein